MEDEVRVDPQRDKCDFLDAFIFEMNDSVKKII